MVFQIKFVNKNCYECELGFSIDLVAFDRDGTGLLGQETDFKSDNL